MAESKTYEEYIMGIKKNRGKYLGKDDKYGRRKYKKQYNSRSDEEKGGFRIQNDKHGINNEVPKYGCIMSKTVRWLSEYTKENGHELHISKIKR